MGALSDFFVGASTEKEPTSDFGSRLDKAKTAYKEQFGKDLPITSQARTRDEQQRLYDAFKQGKPGIYMPLNPADFPGKQTFHESAADIPASVPESFLNQFGIHRPLGKRDPVHAVAMPGEQTSGSLSSFFSGAPPAEEQKGVKAEDLSKPFVGFPSAKKPTIQRSLEQPSTLGQLGQGLASLADVTIGGIIPGVAGPLTYAGARAMQKSPEEAAALQQKVVSATESPFGKAFGVTETPGYKGEATRQLMDFVAQNGIEPAAQAISQKMGIPLDDARNMVGTVMAGATPAVAKAAGKVPGAIQSVRDVRAQMQEQLAQRQAQAGAQPGAAPGMTSMGSAAAMPENVLRGNIEAAVSQASPELQAHVKTLNPRAVDLPALETRSLEEKHGINLSRGQRTGDTSLYSQEWNKRGETSTLGEHFNEQPKQFKAAFENTIRKNAPEIFETDPSAIGQAQINALSAKDKVRTDAISNAYKALQDANGGQFPIDVQTLDSSIKSELTKNLKTNHLSASIAGDLKDFYANPTFEAYEALRTNLANEMRSSANGNARAAAYIVRDQLEKLPIFGEQGGSPQAMQLKALADNARALNRERQEILKANPAYRAAVKEAGSLEDVAAQGESLNAEKFHDKFVTKATPEAIRRMKAEIADDPVAMQAMIAGELRQAMRKAGLATDIPDLNPKTLANYIVDNKGRLQEALGPQAMQDLMEIAALSSKVGMPKSGTFNYSNTFSAQIAEMAKQGLAGAAEAKLATMTGGASIPAVSLGRQMMQKMNKEGFAREAVNPYGGLTKD